MYCPANDVDRRSDALSLKVTEYNLADPPPTAPAQDPVRVNCSLSPGAVDELQLARTSVATHNATTPNPRRIMNPPERITGQPHSRISACPPSPTPAPPHSTDIRDRTRARTDTRQ